MEKFNYLIDASFNLLKASEENEANLRTAIKNLDANTNILKNNVQNIDSNVRDAVNSSSKDAAASISREILLDLNNANEMANSAAERYERAARFSIVKLGGMFFLFFLLAGVFLWFFFIKEIPTISEIQTLREEKADLEADVLNLKKYGDILTCERGQYCVQVDVSKKYSLGKLTLYNIVPKK